MSATILALLPGHADACGCSLFEGRCDRHRGMVQEIHAVWNTGTNETARILWSFSDGYGEAGYMPEQGFDWSGIRDSSCDAIEQMWKAVHA